MTDVAASTEGASDAPDDDSSDGDERLAYRGVYQRLFIRPEIGALIGVIGLWIFFWAVSVPFGTAGGTSRLIDFASSPLGIMAVAVSMLMVGGEFDLSAGAMTGAMGILVILLSLEIGERGGAGLNLWFAVPLSLVFALAVGYWNGFLVERTALPSFIITLGTFFILIGAKLGFSKLIVDQVQVGDIRDASGYDFWQTIFASEWIRNDHQWAQRDRVFLVLILLAIAVAVLATAEMQFASRRGSASPLGLPLLAGGTAAVVVGVVVLHQTDSVGGNWLGSAIIGPARSSVSSASACGDSNRSPIVALPRCRHSRCVGSASAWRGSSSRSWSRRPWTPRTSPTCSSRSLIRGSEPRSSWCSSAVALTAMFISMHHARRSSVMARSLVLAVLTVALRRDGVLHPLRIGVGQVPVRGVRRAAGGRHDRRWPGWCWGCSSPSGTRSIRSPTSSASRMLGVAGLLGTVAFVVKLLFTLDEEIEAGINPANFSVRSLWFAGFTAAAVFVLGQTRFGSWTFAVGGNKEASRQVGVPAARTKTQLFMLVSGASWLVGMLLAFRLNTIQANTGNGEEFEYIIAAVVGGTLPHGRLRHGARRCARRDHHRPGDARYPVRSLELRLAVPVPRRDAVARRARQPVDSHEGGGAAPMIISTPRSMFATTSRSFHHG